MSYNRAKFGVGLRMEGLPSDTATFQKIVNFHGCHPKAADRILARIADRGFDLLTVQPTLQFDTIIRQLATVGVKVSIIDPQPDWEALYEEQDGPWPEEAIPSEELRRKGLDIC